MKHGQIYYILVTHFQRHINCLDLTHLPSSHWCKTSTATSGVKTTCDQWVPHSSCNAWSISRKIEVLRIFNILGAGSRFRWLKSRREEDFAWVEIDDDELSEGTIEWDFFFLVFFPETLWPLFLRTDLSLEGELCFKCWLLRGEDTEFDIFGDLCTITVGM